MDQAEVGWGGEGIGSHGGRTPTSLFFCCAVLKREEATQQEVVSRPAGWASLPSGSRDKSRPEKDADRQIRWLNGMLTEKWKNSLSANVIWEKFLHAPAQVRHLINNFTVSHSHMNMLA